MKSTILDQQPANIHVIDTEPHISVLGTKNNCKDIHTSIVQVYLSRRPINKILLKPPLEIHKTEQKLDRQHRTLLGQLRSGKSPFLLSYLHHINPTTYITELCPLCRTHTHNTPHLFSCPQLPTKLTLPDLWNFPTGVADLLNVWAVHMQQPGN